MFILFNNYINKQLKTHIWSCRKLSGLWKGLSIVHRSFVGWFLIYQYRRVQKMVKHIYRYVCKYVYVDLCHSLPAECTSTDTPNAVILESVILEQLASFVLLSVFPFELHNGVGLQKLIIFIVYIRQYLAIFWRGMFNSSKCLLCTIFLFVPSQSCPSVYTPAWGRGIESCLKPWTKTWMRISCPNASEFSDESQILWNRPTFLSNHHSWVSKRE